MEIWSEPLTSAITETSANKQTYYTGHTGAINSVFGGLIMDYCACNVHDLCDVSEGFTRWLHPQCFVIKKYPHNNNNWAPFSANPEFITYPERSPGSGPSESKMCKMSIGQLLGMTQINHSDGDNYGVDSKPEPRFHVVSSGIIFRQLPSRIGTRLLSWFLRISCGQGQKEVETRRLYRVVIINYGERRGRWLPVTWDQLSGCGWVMCGRRRAVGLYMATVCHE